MSKIKAALTRKIGPLPAWVYLAALFAGVYYWRHRNAAAASAAVGTGSAAGASSGAGTGTSGYGSASGGDSGGGDSSSSEPPTTGVGAPVSWDPTQASPSGPAGVRDPDPATTSSAPAPTTRAPLGRGGSQPYATSAGTLQWGGRTFTSQTEFQTWARQHGTTVRAELRKHPEAQRLYESLKPAPAHHPSPTKATTGSIVHATDKRTRTATAKPAGRPADRPVSVRAVSKQKPAAPAPHAAHPLLTSSRTPSTSKNAGAAHTAPQHAPTAPPKPAAVPPPAQTAHEHHETPAPPPKKQAPPKKKQAKKHAPAV